MLNYVLRVGITVSVLLNVVTGGASNQTFSARNYIWKHEGRRNLVDVIDRIFFWEPQHCMQCWVHWVIRENRSNKPLGNMPQIVRTKKKKGDLQPFDYEV